MSCNGSIDLTSKYQHSLWQTRSSLVHKGSECVPQGVADPVGLASPSEASKTSQTWEITVGSTAEILPPRLADIVKAFGLVFVADVG